MFTTADYKAHLQDYKYQAGKWKAQPKMHISAIIALASTLGLAVPLGSDGGLGRSPGTSDLVGLGVGKPLEPISKNKVRPLNQKPSNQENAPTESSGLRRSPGTSDLIGLGNGNPTEQISNNKLKPLDQENIPSDSSGLRRSPGTNDLAGLANGNPTEQISRNKIRPLGQRPPNQENIPLESTGGMRRSPGTSDLVGLGNGNPQEPISNNKLKPVNDPISQMGQEDSGFSAASQHDVAAAAAADAAVAGHGGAEHGTATEHAPITAHEG